MDWLQRRHYTFLLATLLLFLLAYPYLEGRGSVKEWLLQSIFLGTLVVAIDKLNPGKWDLAIGSVFAIAIWLIELCLIFKFNLFGSSTELVQTILTFLFYAAGTLAALIYVMRPKHVTSETFAACAFVYLMLGVTCGQAFQLIHLTIPNSFHESGAELGKVLTWTDFLYFSFATMTSTGYGDLTPVSSQARSIASLEALIGQFYIAVIVARLVGLDKKIVPPEEKEQASNSAA
jgi:Ion channel.